MIEVSVAIQIGENSGEGSFVNVINVETIPTPHGNPAGAFLQAQMVVQRLSDDVTARALDQAGEWSRSHVE
jgi:hypothetical protein